MRTLRIFPLLFLAFSGFAQNPDALVPVDLSQKAPGALPELQYAARGTGRTTGHVITLTIHNPTDKASTFDLPACYIPATGTYQPYVVPYLPTITVGPGNMVEVPLQGFCTDIHRPPVPVGEAMTPVSSWVFPDPAVPAETYFVADGSAWTPVAPDAVSAVVPIIPGTDTPWPYTLDTEKDPGTTAGIFLDVIDRIRQQYDRMREQNLITTPFSGNVDKERESVVQQTFWMYTAAITGTGYDKDDFTQQTVKQYETYSGKPMSAAPPETKEKMEEGIDQFWGTFQAVGVEAKILATHPEGGSSQPELFKDGEKKDDKKKVDGKCACTSMELDLALNIQNKAGNMIADADRTQTATFEKGKKEVKLKKIKASASNVEVGKKVELTVTPKLECTCSEDGGKCPATGSTTVTIKHKKEELDDEFSLSAVPFEIEVTVTRTCGSDDCKEITCTVEIPILIEKDKKK